MHCDSLKTERTKSRSVGGVYTVLPQRSATQRVVGSHRRMAKNLPDDMRGGIPAPKPRPSPTRMVKQMQPCGIFLQIGAQLRSSEVSNEVYQSTRNTMHRQFSLGQWQTFKGAELRDFLTCRGIKWHYIVERSPLWERFHERMVKSVKRCLKVVFNL